MLDFLVLTATPIRTILGYHLTRQGRTYLRVRLSPLAGCRGSWSRGRRCPRTQCCAGRISQGDPQQAREGQRTV